MNTTLPSLVSTFNSLRQRYDSLVLASVVETHGSTYRKAGAHMLITPDAEYFGLLGGGCFEADLLAHAETVFREKQSSTIFYDMRAPEDEIWGLGLGCNGAVRIHLQYLSTNSETHIISVIEKCLQSRSRSVILNICHSNHNSFASDSHHLLVFENNEVANLPVDSPQILLETANRAYLSGNSLWSDYKDDNLEIQAFFNVITPPFHLMIIGAGPDAQPIVNFASQLGWNITLVDYRESFLEQLAFADVNQRQLCLPEELSAKTSLDTIDAVVLMTHKIEFDERYLNNLVDTTARYVGLLGPAARRDRLLEALGDKRSKIEDRVFGPVGLNIGGELPEEIALSLVSEIQATLYSKDATSLHKKTTPLHDSQSFGLEHLHTVILAAGGARRFGGLKQLLEYKGQSLLRRCVDIATELLDERVWVVLGARSQKVKREIENLDVHVLFNDNWEKGLATSMRTGIDELLQTAQACCYCFVIRL